MPLVAPIFGNDQCFEQLVGGRGGLVGAGSVVIAKEGQDDPALLQATSSRVGGRQSGCFEQPQLLKRRDAIVQADLFHNLTFLEAKHGRTR